MPKAEEIDLKLEEPIKTPTTAAADPFATDFFTQKSERKSDEPAAKARTESNFDVDFALSDKTENRALWQNVLPQVKSADAQNSRNLARLPLEFSEKILPLAEKTVSSLVLNDAARARCEIIAVTENDFFAEINLLAAEQAVFLTFAVEPSRTMAAFAIDAAFAVQLIETAFGAEQRNSNEKTLTAERRMLSPTELTVLEFFAASFFSLLNEHLGEPLFRQIAAGQNIPAWFSQTKATVEHENSDIDLGLPQTSETARPSRGLAVKINLRLGDRQFAGGVVYLLLPFYFLENLSEVQNPLLLRHNSSAKRDRLKKILAETSLRVLLGETTLTADDLAVLERNDIILIEKTAVSHKDSALTGKTLVKIAAETLGSLYGDLTTDASSAHKLRFNVREIRQESVGSETARLKMDEQLTNENGAATAAETSALALEKIIVTMTVELVSRRLTLDELASLRSGQIIDLGCKATDPVELVADGKTVAIGELVDVEGSLGVRVLRILI
jgi:type III secretion system YscQ/HrcQ family protein